MSHGPDCQWDEVRARMWCACPRNPSRVEQAAVRACYAVAWVLVAPGYAAVSAARWTGRTAVGLFDRWGHWGCAAVACVGWLAGSAPWGAAAFVVLLAVTVDGVNWYLRRRLRARPGAR